MEFFDFHQHPGHLYVVATVLPLVSFVLLLLAGGVRSYLRRYREAGGPGEAAYHLFGGDAPGKTGGYVATAAIFLAFLCTLFGFIQLLYEQHLLHESHEKVSQLREQLGHRGLSSDELKRLAQERDKAEREAHQAEQQHDRRWAGQVTWASINPEGLDDPKRATALFVGFYIDSLAGVMFLMVTFVAFLIHVFSIGYMSEELAPEVADHEVHTEHGHLHRRGRFPRFFMYFSLFSFSMLNLILANNLFQVFLSWELVGICSYLLIGFYYERRSASDAANKAFITNRVGDAGFVIGLVILWTYLGTFNFQEIFARLRTPAEHGHGAASLAGQIVRAQPVPSGDEATTERAPGTMQVRVLKREEGWDWDTQAVIFPRQFPSHYHAPGFNKAAHEQSTLTVYANPRPDQRPPQHGSMPYWLLVAAGLGIFLGCVGKSAQFPLHVWLPDAMEGPTPVSALIHAATMVAAGVYLVGRVFPLFTAEALLVIAYTGGVTLFVAATIALVMTDIKKVLAYSTVSQLGYMMLALGVGGWVAGLFHLITHAFFKALLFLCSGSVIYGCHHVQEMTRMGGLYPKMKVTALTMLVGCLAIAGTPFFSGYYSKDAILANALGFAVVYREHMLLFLLPLLTAGLTTFYMFRMWFMTFTGPPRDEEVHERAHESPRVMTVPLVLLAVFSVVVAWGWPPWEPEESWLEHQIAHSQPNSILADFGGVIKYGDVFETSTGANVINMAAQMHSHAGGLAILAALLGFILAYLLYYRRTLDPAEAEAQVPGVAGFLRRKWYFDELYSAIVVRPGLVVAGWCRWFDTYVIDGIINGLGRLTVGLSRRGVGWADLRIVDGLVNLVATVCYATGTWLRRVQTGYLRSYVLFLVLAAVGIWAVLYLTLTPPGTR
jgi:NADH-quinone oxidoreductase subunit L